MARDAIFFVFVLIFLFLMVNNGDKTTAIIAQLGDAFNTSVKNLQGR
jgi:hypothetical protein